MQLSIERSDGSGTSRSHIAQNSRREAAPKPLSAPSHSAGYRRARARSQTNEENASHTASKVAWIYRATFSAYHHCLYTLLLLAIPLCSVYLHETGYACAGRRTRRGAQSGLRAAALKSELRHRVTFPVSDVVTLVSLDWNLSFQGMARPGDDIAVDFRRWVGGAGIWIMDR